MVDVVASAGFGMMNAETGEPFGYLFMALRMEALFFPVASAAFESVHLHIAQRVTSKEKNALFAGSDARAENWVRLASLIGTCKLNSINPQAYIEATLRKILKQQMQGEIKDFMPWNFKA